MGINFVDIRERLIALKKSRKMNNYDFCRIYAPEKCTSKTNAENYISALSTGREYPNQGDGPLYPDLAHLQNIVDSDEFPDVTLNYLVYGTETPAKVINKIDFDLSHWTLADFCEFLWTLKIRYPKNINIENEINDRVNIYGEPIIERQAVIRIDEINEDPGKREEFSLGQAIVLFQYEAGDTENNKSLKVRELGFSEAVKLMRSRSSFLTDLSNCNETPFIRIYGGEDE